MTGIRYSPRSFLTDLVQVGVHSVKLPPRSPNLNSYTERFVRSIKQSCLDRVILFGEESLRTAVREFIAHYHTERNHQGIGTRLIVPRRRPTIKHGPVRRKSRLGGRLNYYDRAT